MAVAATGIAQHFATRMHSALHADIFAAIITATRITVTVQPNALRAKVAAVPRRRAIVTVTALNHASHTRFFQHDIDFPQ